LIIEYNLYFLFCTAERIFSKKEQFCWSI